MNNNDPGGLSPQQMRTLGIMGGLFLLCFIVISLVSDLDIPGPIHTLIRHHPHRHVLRGTPRLLNVRQRRSGTLHHPYSPVRRGTPRTPTRELRARGR